MNATQLAMLVDEGLALTAEIDAKEKRLKEIEKTLKAHAEKNPSRHIPLKDEDREGTRFLCPGSTRILPITFTADAIVQSMEEGTEQLSLIRALAGPRFGDFYARKVTYATLHTKSSKFDGKAFRAAARERLSDPERFIQACVRKDKHGIPVSSVKVEWAAAEPAD